MTKVFYIGRKKESQKTMEKKHIFKGGGLFEHEYLIIDETHITFRKRGLSNSPQLTITFPIKNIHFIEPSFSLSGNVLIITSYANNTIVAKGFNRSDIRKIEHLLKN